MGGGGGMGGGFGALVQQTGSAFGGRAGYGSLDHLDLSVFGFGLVKSWKGRIEGKTWFGRGNQFAVRVSFQLLLIPIGDFQMEPQRHRLQRQGWQQGHLPVPSVGPELSAIQCRGGDLD